MAAQELNKQQAHWETMYTEDDEMFGAEPSEPAILAAKLFKSKGKTTILELGGGQGRDTFYFAQNGFNVVVLDYSETGIHAIQQKANALGLSDKITAIVHDVRTPLPFSADSFDACFSHMLFCMAITTQELAALSKEILRVLKPNGLNFYTARNTHDAHFQQGVHHGEDLYEMFGFIVHFFSEEKVRLLAEGYDIVSIDEFEEGELPRVLYRVVLQKPDAQ